MYLIGVYKKNWILLTQIYLMIFNFNAILLTFKSPSVLYGDIL